jgi:hypothetical protein
MRTGQVASILVMGLIMTTFFVGTANAGCNDLIAQPTRCAVAYFEFATGTISTSLGSGQVWAGVLLEEGSACPSVDAGFNFTPETGDVDSYLDTTQGNLGDAAEGLAGATLPLGPFPVLAYLVDGTWVSTRDLGLGFAASMDDMRAEVSSNVFDLIPTSPEDMPTLPDPTADADVLIGQATGAATEAGNQANLLVVCVQGLPPPPL